MKGKGDTTRRKRRRGNDDDDTSRPHGPILNPSYVGTLTLPFLLTRCHRHEPSTTAKAFVCCLYACIFIGLVDQQAGDLQPLTRRRAQCRTDCRFQLPASAPNLSAEAASDLESTVEDNCVHMSPPRVSYPVAGRRQWLRYCTPRKASHH